MTVDQEIAALRAEILANPRLLGLVQAVGRSAADRLLRDNYLTTDTAMQHRNTGGAHAIEKFVKLITEPEKSSPRDRNARERLE